MNSNKKQLLSISELSMHLGLINEKNGKPANHILRFWESKFKEIKPTIFKGKRRMLATFAVENPFVVSSSSESLKRPTSPVWLYPVDGNLNSAYPEAPNLEITK